MIRNTMKVHSVQVCLLLLALCLLAGGVVAAPAPPLANVVILIVRHAEKPDSGPGLTPAGQQRATSYVRYFEEYRIGTQVLRVDRLIAAADTKASQRPRLTLEPLSRALKLPIDTQYRDKDTDALAQALKTQPGGKTILICWHHGDIPSLLQALGGDSDALLPKGKWPEGVYNWVIQLRYDGRGHLVPAQARRINEHLLPGDSD
jgi:broad specificity phosphatase PhoE